MDVGGAAPETADSASNEGCRDLDKAVDANVYAVVMAGGSGTRFWPLSRSSRPKQFLRLLDERSLLQRTWQRSLQLLGDPQRILVVTSVAYADMTREQLPELRQSNLLLEPQARNTAPCLAWAATLLAKRDPRSIMVVLPADHVIEDVDGFCSAVSSAVLAARHTKALVTFGVPPRYPETGYGYIETGEPLSLPEADQALPVQRVVGFREKPDLDTARQYMEAGRFLWNSGIFVWETERLMQEISTHLPEAAVAARQMLKASDSEVSSVYARMPATSIDYGIMERADNVACIQAPFDWSDVGSWSALRELLDGDDAGNVSWNQVVALDAHDNLVYAPDELVALLGVDGVAVIRAGDVLLVASLERAQEIKALRRRLEKLGLDKHL